MKSLNAAAWFNASSFHGNVTDEGRRWFPGTEGTHYAGVPLADYRLPDGSIVRVDDSAAKGATVIDFTLQGGAIVQAVRVRQQEGGSMKGMKPWKVVTYDIDARPIHVTYYEHYESACLCSQLVNTAALACGMHLGTWVESNAR